MDGVGDIVETRSYVFLLNKDILSLLPGGTWSSLPALGCNRVHQFNMETFLRGDGKRIFFPCLNWVFLWHGGESEEMEGVLGI